jgi:hypothetical protein
MMVNFEAGLVAVSRQPHAMIKGLTIMSKDPCADGCFHRDQSKALHVEMVQLTFHGQRYGQYAEIFFCLMMVKT